MNEPEKLVDAETLIDVLFNEASRPSLRTVRNWQADRAIPYIKLGGRVWFNPSEVRRALADKFTIQSRN